MKYIEAIIRIPIEENVDETERLNVVLNHVRKHGTEINLESCVVGYEDN